MGYGILPNVRIGSGRAAKSGRFCQGSGRRDGFTYRGVSLRKGAQDEHRFQGETNKDVRTLQDEATVSGRNQKGNEDASG